MRTVWQCTLVTWRKTTATISLPAFRSFCTQSGRARAGTSVHTLCVLRRPQLALTVYYCCTGAAWRTIRRTCALAKAGEEQLTHAHHYIAGVTRACWRRRRRWGVVACLSYHACHGSHRYAASLLPRPLTPSHLACYRSDHPPASLYLCLSLPLLPIFQHCCPEKNITPIAAARWILCVSRKPPAELRLCRCYAAGGWRNGRSLVTARRVPADVGSLPVTGETLSVPAPAGGKTKISRRA